jgi:hypothetical protein
MQIVQFQFLLGQNGSWIEDVKSARIENRLYDFRATFSSLFKYFWSMNFVGIGGNISREKKSIFIYMLK